VKIPEIKSRFGLSDFVLSFTMLAVAGGAIVAMGPVGRWATRIGSARALTISGAVYAAATAMIPLMPSFTALLPLLIVLGMSMAGFDVTMNVQAAGVEVQGGRPIMSTLHGMFSVGGMTGAGLGGLAALAGLPSWLYTGGIALVALAAIALGSPHLLQDAPHKDERARIRSGRAPAALWVLGFFAFLGLICEGAMYDWASVYLRDVAHAAPQLASYGYAAFSTGMACGRFAADPLRRRVGDGRTLSVGTWLGFAGIALAVCIPEPSWTLAGFLLMGLGVANLMPFFFLAGARLPGMSPAQGVAAIARCAYAGMLLGPAIIGGITRHAGLQAALGAVAVIMGLIASVGIRQARRMS
jgi:predicted MFS family arabinose efflux permease